MQSFSKKVWKIVKTLSVKDYNEIMRLQVIKLSLKSAFLEGGGAGKDGSFDVHWNILTSFQGSMFPLRPNSLFSSSLQSRSSFLRLV